MQAHMRVVLAVLLATAADAMTPQCQLREVFNGTGGSNFTQARPEVQGGLVVTYQADVPEVSGVAYPVRMRVVSASDDVLAGVAHAADGGLVGVFGNTTTMLTGTAMNGTEVTLSVVPSTAGSRAARCYVLRDGVSAGSFACESPEDESFELVGDVECSMTEPGCADGEEVFSQVQLQVCVGPVVTPTPGTPTPTTPQPSTAAPVAPGFSSFCQVDADCRGQGLDPAAVCENNACRCVTPGFNFPASASAVRVCVAQTIVSLLVSVTLQFRDLVVSAITAADGQLFTRIANAALGTVVSGRVVVTAAAGGGAAFHCLIDARIAVLSRLATGSTTLVDVWNTAGASAGRAAQVLTVRTATGGVVQRGNTCSIDNASRTSSTADGCRVLQCRTGFRPSADNVRCLESTTTPAPNARGSEDDDDLTAGEKAAIGVSVSVFVLLVIAAVVYFVCLRKGNEQGQHKEDVSENEPIQAA